MKLTTTAQVSVDGVMQGPGGPDEDERGVFERGGWAHFDDESSAAMDRIYERADVFLFGSAPTRSLPAPGERGRTRATARSGRRCTSGPSTSHRPHPSTRSGRHDRPLR
jgi:hypothetical protein